MKLRRKKVGETRLRPKAAEVLAGQNSERDMVMFDPERDITSEDILEIENELAGHLRNDELIQQLGLALPLAILRPELIDELAEKVSFDDILTKMLNSTDSVLGDPTDRYAMGLTILFPRLKNELREENTFAVKKEKMESYRNTDWGRYSLHATELAILYPERVDDMDLSDTFEPMREQMIDFGKNGHWGSYGFVAMNIVILFPERKSELDLQKSIPMMISEMNKRRGSNWMAFAELAMAVTILTNDGLEISEAEGLKLIRKQKPLQSQTPLPERPAA